MLTGKVKWFNSAKGYGFICLADGRDVFVHYSSIDMDGYRFLKAGQAVSFELNQGEKGLHATDIQLIGVSYKLDSPTHVPVNEEFSHLNFADVVLA